MSIFPWPQAVVVLGTDETAVAGFAPRFEPQWTRPNLVTWFEGGHERCFEVEQVEHEDADLFRFRSTRGLVYSLLPMTLARYNAHVRERTVGKPTFESLDELLRVMRREW